MRRKERLQKLNFLADKFLDSLDDPINPPLCLLRFAKLKNFLGELNKESRKWAKKNSNDVYLLRTIVVFYESLRHLDQENVKNLSQKQQAVILEIVGKMKGKIQREDYQEIYKKLIRSGFRIIPEPAPVG